MEQNKGKLCYIANYSNENIKIFQQQVIELINRDISDFKLIDLINEYINYTAGLQSRVITLLSKTITDQYEEQSNQTTIYNSATWGVLICWP